MIEKEESAELVKYNLILKSKTNRLRTREALGKLKSLYPYKLEKNNIRLRETGNKNEFLVYINKQGFPVEQKKFYWFLLLGSICIILAVVVFALNNNIAKKNLILQEEREKEKEYVRKEKEEEELQAKIKVLSEQVNQKHEQSYSRVYTQIELIYSLIKKNAIIENLSLDSDDFSLEISATEGMNILESFENCNQLTEVKMTRTTSVLNKDQLLINGKFVKNRITADPDMMLENQVLFYEGILSSYELRMNKQREQNLSDYIKELRRSFKKHNCREQYIQVKGEKENREIEVMLYSSSKSILSFLKQIQDGEDNLFDIKSLRIRNSDSSENIQTLILFHTGIPVKKNEPRDYLEAEEKIFSPEEISSSLYKQKKTQEKKAVEDPSRKIMEKKPEKIKKTLVYIGQSKTNSINYMIAKDEQMNAIYKFELKETDGSGNICFINEDGKCIARYNNELYEVRR